MCGAKCKIIDTCRPLVDAGVPADLDPPVPNPLADMDPPPPGPNSLADLDPPPRIWTLQQLTKLSENIILNVPVKMDDTLRSSAY